jgi:GR25 family glycosyltransferase involved in LPS biosynthesis
MKIEIIIIAREENINQSSLLLELGEEWQASINLMKAITPNDLTLPKELKNSNGLSEVEIAISESHRLARKIASQKNLDWALILEEDAICLQTKKSLLDFVTSIEFFFKPSTPLAIHFAPEQFGLLWKKKNEPFFRVEFIPDCAVAYALNSASLQYLASYPQHIIEVADWPKPMRKIKWLAPLTPFFAHPNVTESISSTMLHRRARRAQKFSIVRWATLSRVKALVLILSRVVAKEYGNGYVEDERFRTRIVHFF